MTTFVVTVEVERAVPATRAEAAEAGRMVARYLRSWTYRARVVKAKTRKRKS